MQSYRGVLKTWALGTKEKTDFDTLEEAGAGDVDPGRSSTCHMSLRVVILRGITSSVHRRTSLILDAWGWGLDLAEVLAGQHFGLVIWTGGSLYLTGLGVLHSFPDLPNFPLAIEDPSSTPEFFTHTRNCSSFPRFHPTTSQTLILCYAEQI